MIDTVEYTTFQSPLLINQSIKIPIGHYGFSFWTVKSDSDFILLLLLLKNGYLREDIFADDIFAEDIFAEDIFANSGQIRENIFREIKVKLRIRENIFHEIFSKMRFFKIHVNLVQ